MTATRQFPPVMGSVIAGRAAFGLVATAVAASLLAVFFDLSAIASIGSVIALVVFTMITAGHIRVRSETGANVFVLAIAVSTTVAVLVAFVFTSLVDEPATAVTLVAITVGSIAIDAWWKRRRDRADRTGPTLAAQI
jgi:hypothetical protein